MVFSERIVVFGSYELCTVSVVVFHPGWSQPCAGDDIDASLTLVHGGFYQRNLPKIIIEEFIVFIVHYHLIYQFLL